MNEDDHNFPALAPDVVKQLADNQAHELQIRADELALKRQENEHNFEYAQKLLAAQLEDRKHQRTADIQSHASRFRYVTLLTIVACFFIGYLAYINKEALALELLKAAVYLAGGAIGGYFYGRQVKNKDANEGME